MTMMDPEKPTPDSTASTSTSNPSARAVEAWNSVPADSEAQADYATVNNFTIPVNPDDKYFSLDVEIMVRTPDGQVITHSESIECSDVDDYNLDEAIGLLDASYRVMADRLGR